MALSQAQVRELLIGLFPPGARRLYDLDNTDSIVYRLIDSTAAALKAHGTDIVDSLRSELFLPDERLPDWEAALRISRTKTAIDGTTAERRAAVIAKIREQGASTHPNIQAATQKWLSYPNPADIRVMECDRDALRLAHTYTTTGDSVIPSGGSVTKSFTVADDADVSVGGARVTFVITHAEVEDLRIRLTSPTGTIKTWSAGTWANATGSVTAQSYTLWTDDHVGLDIIGAWVLTVTDTGANAGTLGTSSLFVEGAGLDSTSRNGLGAVIYEWGVFVDPTRTTVASVDMDALWSSIRRWAPAHTLGTIIRGSSTVSPGTPLAIPDDPSCIPDRVIPTDGAWPHSFALATNTASHDAAATVAALHHHRRARHPSTSGWLAYVRVP